MGVINTDLFPFTISPITPAPKSSLYKFFQLSRSSTVSAVLVDLPAQATIMGVKQFGSVASNAGTSATVTITVANNTGTISSGTSDVKTNGATTMEVQMSGLPNIQPIPNQGDITISALIAEVGTASTAGGPWTYMITYTA